MAKHAANILTSCRMLGSILLLFFPVFSAAFSFIYLFCGFSDMIDGTVARKTNSAGKFGSRLDAAADLVFITAAMIRLLPAIRLPQWVWFWGGAIAAIKIGNLILRWVRKKQFLSLHTKLNKITGLLLFLLPMTISFVALKYSSIIVCCLATLAAVQEGFFVITNRTAAE